MTGASIEPLGDGALLIRLAERIDPAINARALALAATLRAATLPGVIDVAPAYASVCVRYDMTAWSMAQRQPYDAIAARLHEFVETATASAAEPALPLCQIPLCYGSTFGPDLDAVARHAQLDRDTVIARHSAAEYRVAMLGFAPGFPYLLGLDPALHTPRHATPRTRVPGGSVAIGGAQTGIYPRELPGGWQIIGRTPVSLFDPARDPAALLVPGQRVRFRAITAEEFATLAR